MIVFKTFLKVVKANKGILILYTVLLAVFGGVNMQTSDNNISFTKEKPSIYIVNNDKDNKFTEGFVNYLKENCEVKDIENTSDKINDALFYRDVNYVIYIPKDYGYNFMNNNEILLDIKETENIESSITEMMVDKYINTARTYRDLYNDESLVIKNVNEVIKNEADISIASKIDTEGLSNTRYYFNFLNYSMIATTVYIIGVVISSFREEKIRKRTEISSTNYKKINKYLLLSNAIFVLIVWFMYMIIGYILVGNTLISQHGLFYLLNSFIFAISALTLGFLIANITSNRNAISGIVNVVALGTSFLCGSFVPMELLPKAVLNIAHVLPSYWYIKNNELLKTIEVLNSNNLKEVYVNMLVVIVFSVIFIVITNIIANKKRKIN